MYKWVKADEMFPYEYIECTYGRIRKTDLINYPYIDIICTTFCRNVVEKMDRIRYFCDGNVERACIYSALPYNNPDGFSPVSVYGALILKNE